jgi:protein-L-isoaspartate(D-aspartate) O-methyltransferase
MDRLDAPGADSHYARLRSALVVQIEAEARATAAYTGRERFSPAVLAALAKVPRHRFVPPEQGSLAYLDAALAIGYGQTISQPYIVALMTDLLDLAPGGSALDIGCGSGYQAAVLAELGCRVHSIERIEALADAARDRLRRLGYLEATVACGDGYLGCPERAPFDAIVIAAATPEIPLPLLAQLKPGGRLVVPLGATRATQQLTRVVKREGEGGFEFRSVLPVVFVPFVRSVASSQ